MGVRRGVRVERRCSRGRLHRGRRRLQRREHELGRGLGLRQLAPATALWTMPGGAALLRFEITKLSKAVAAWQLSQGAVPNGMWLAGGDRVIGEPTNPGAAPAAWQVAQATPGTVACTMAGGAVPETFGMAKLLKIAGAWQLSQDAEPNGMWLAGGAFNGSALHTPAKLSPRAWHCAHLSMMPVWLIANCV